MTDSSLQTPLLFLIYNRPEHTQKVFDINRSFRPSRLFVAADGHSLYVSNDAGKFAAARMVVKQVDWNSDVRLSIREKNMPTKFAEPEAIKLCFSYVEKGIIPENDCLPDPSLYSFSTTLLERYRTDSGVMQINRSNFLREKGFDLKGSSYSSKLCHPRELATWKIKWSLVDFELKELDLFISEDKFTVLTPKVEFRNKCFTQLSKTTASKVDRWDFQWYYTGGKLNRLVITSIYCLVSNCGFGIVAANTNYF